MVRNATEYDVSILVHGKPIKTYSDSKTGRVFVEGRKGSNFTLRVRNFTGSRVLAVVTVDGLSVMDGNPGDWNSGGYIVPAWGKIEIPGWRLDNDNVAKFEFAGKKQSYSKQSGEGTANCGVIGVAIFKEKQWTYIPYVPPTIIREEHHHHHHDHWPCRGIWIGGTTTTTQDPLHWTYTSSNTLGSSSFTANAGGDMNIKCSTFLSQPADGSCEVEDSYLGVHEEPETQHLGTGFGEQTRNHVDEVSFQRATDTPYAIYEIHYDSKQGLAERGVLNQPQVCRKPEGPKAFPKNNKGCTPPAGWNR